jgi:hypothetical protein
MSIHERRRKERTPRVEMPMHMIAGKEGRKEGRNPNMYK